MKREGEIGFPNSFSLNLPAGKFNTETYIQYLLKTNNYTYFQSKEMNFKSKHNWDSLRFFFLMDYWFLHSKLLGFKIPCWTNIPGGTMRDSNDDITCGFLLVFISRKGVITDFSQIVTILMGWYVKKQRKQMRMCEKVMKEFWPLNACTHFHRHGGVQLFLCSSSRSRRPCFASNHVPVWLNIIQAFLAHVLSTALWFIVNDMLSLHHAK